MTIMALNKSKLNPHLEHDNLRPPVLRTVLRFGTHPVVIRLSQGRRTPGREDWDEEGRTSDEGLRSVSSPNGK